MTSPSMLLSLDKPSPAAAAAAAVLLLLEPAAGDEELVAVTGPPSVEIVIVSEPSVVVVGAVPLAGPSTRVTVKFAGFVDVAEVLGRDQVVDGEEVQSVLAWAPIWSRLGFVSCAWARLMVVVAPSAARMW